MASQIRRQQVLGELDPLVRQPTHRCKSLCQGCLCHSWNPLYEKMTIGEQTDQEVLDLIGVTHYRLADLCPHGIHGCFYFLVGSDPCSGHCTTTPWNSMDDSSFDNPLI